MPTRAALPVSSPRYQHDLVNGTVATERAQRHLSAFYECTKTERQR
jgi:hypothetical protein